MSELVSTESVNAVSSEQAPAAVSDAVANVGAESPETQSAAVETVDEGTETTSHESEEIAERDKGYKKTFEERLAEIEAQQERKIEERIKALKAAEEAAKVETPDFIPVDYTAFDMHIAKLIAAEKRIADELAFEPEDPRPFLQQLRQIQRERAQLEHQFSENEQKRQAWEQKRQAVERDKQFHTGIQAEIDRTVELLPQTTGIDAEALNAGRDFLKAKFVSEPALQKKFDDIILHKATYHGFSGVQAAVEWAVGYAKENMGKAAETAKQQREAGKSNQPVGGDISGGGEFGNIHTFDDLMKLPSKSINKFASEHPQKFQNLKDKKFK